MNNMIIKTLSGLRLRTPKNIYNLKLDKNNMIVKTKNYPQYVYFSQNYTRYSFGDNK